MGAEVSQPAPAAEEVVAAAAAPPAQAKKRLPQPMPSCRHLRTGDDRASAAASAPDAPAATSSVCCVSRDDRPKGDSETSRAQFARLLANNESWRAEIVAHDASYFSRSAFGQTPKYLWIGCVDSRVPAESVVGLKPGDMLVHRNVGNLVIANDLNVMAVITFAVEVLHVEHIIVAGHYGCGAVNAASRQQSDVVAVDLWLQSIRDTVRIHAAELDKLDNEPSRSCSYHDTSMSCSVYGARHRRLVELSLIEQCINVHKTPVVQRRRAATRALATGAQPSVWPCVYDPSKGKLNLLEYDMSDHWQRIKHIYK